MWEKTPPIQDLKDTLEDPSTPIAKRMRAAYYLRQIHHDHQNNNNSDSEAVVEQASGKEQQQQEEEIVVAVLTHGLLDRKHGSLMRHEFAYVMGQLRDDRCCPTLEQVLATVDDCVMVRHESAEALGAIGATRSEPVLRAVLEECTTAGTNIPELAETCRIALQVMTWRRGGEDDADNAPMVACACMMSPYSSVDPAPPHPAHEHKSFQELGDILCDANLPIFDRYRAMFSLRNRGGDDAVRQLCRALTQDTSSALLRHEVAYVLGQMQHPASVEALEESLRRPDEHKMVRHESAEALGAIEGRWDDVERILQEFASNENDVIRESCLVALDGADYWGLSGKHNDEDSDDGGNSDIHDIVNGTMSFAHQKADDRHVLANHFNIAST